MRGGEEFDIRHWHFEVCADIQVRNIPCQLDDAAHVISAPSAACGKDPAQQITQLLDLPIEELDRTDCGLRPGGATQSLSVQRSGSELKRRIQARRERNRGRARGSAFPFERVWADFRRSAYRNNWDIDAAPPEMSGLLDSCRHKRTGIVPSARSANAARADGGYRPRRAAYRSREASQRGGKRPGTQDRPSAGHVSMTGRAAKGRDQWRAGRDRPRRPQRRRQMAPAPGEPAPPPIANTSRLPKTARTVWPSTRHSELRAVSTPGRARQDGQQNGISDRTAAANR